MHGIVTATRLNVRSKPDKNSRKRGLLSRGTVIRITGQLDDWLEFRYEDFPAYVSRAWVQLQNNDRDICAIVKADLLNVRSAPDLQSSILGKLPRAARVDIVSLMPQWAEIRFNDDMGYISRDYIELQQVVDAMRGKVIAGTLNVRNQPSKEGAPLGQLTRNTVVAIQGRTGEWFQVHFNGQKGFVHTHYIQTATIPDEQPPAGPADSDDPVAMIPTIADRERAPLSPERQLPLQGDATTRKVARTWNSYGGLLDDLCRKIEIDVACAVAVLCVESSGKGFQPSNDDRMIIRFENHKFWKYWGRDHAETFRKHFTYKSGQAWKGHKWRRDPDDLWQTFHGTQRKEWQVLDFARTLNDTAALCSISMGAPQIMGFHYARIGYPSVAAMFEAFSSDIEAHIRGLFHFLDRQMISDLQTLNFEGFAGRYNGSGQKETYGRRIKDHYDAFKLLAVTYTL